MHGLQSFLLALNLSVLSLLVVVSIGNLFVVLDEVEGSGLCYSLEITLKFLLVNMLSNYI